MHFAKNMFVYTDHEISEFPRKKIYRKMMKLIINSLRHTLVWLKANNTSYNFTFIERLKQRHKSWKISSFQNSILLWQFLIYYTTDF